MRSILYKNSSNEFDFLSIAYNRIIDRFYSYVLSNRTIPVREINKFCGLIFSLNKRETRMMLKSIANELDNVELNCHGIKIKGIKK